MYKSLIHRRLVSAFLPTCLSSSLALLAAALLAMLSTAACAGNAKDSAGLVGENTRMNSSHRRRYRMPSSA